MSVGTRRPVMPRFGWGRWPRAVGYTLLTACGVLVIVTPVPAVRSSATMAWAALVWGAFLAGGGALSALGAVLDRWPGEYIGLWPLITAFAVWALAALSYPGALAFGLLLLAITCLFLARWRHVSQVRHTVERVPGRVIRA